MTSANVVQRELKRVPAAWVDSGVDYLTCTYGPKSRLTRLRASIARLQAQETALGNMVHDWGMSGYLGFRVGGLEYGWRGDGVIVRLSGPTAQTNWRRFGRLASNCSRIDLQETALWDEEVKTTLTRHWRQMRRWSVDRKNAPALKLISGANGPETIYSGKRASDVYLRAYNRFAKTKDERFRGHLRYEVEYKGDRARFILSDLLESQDAHAAATSHCLTMFRDRGCCLPPPMHSASSFRCPTRSTDVEKRLTWLANQVRCTVRDLVALGYYRETLDALGLSDPVQSDRWSNN